MTTSNWITLGVVVFLALTGLYILYRHLREQARTRARNELEADKTRDEISEDHQSALEKEHQKSDEEAWRDAKRNFRKSH